MKHNKGKCKLGVMAHGVIFRIYNGVVFISVNKPHILGIPKRHRLHQIGPNLYTVTRKGKPIKG